MNKRRSWLSLSTAIVLLSSATFGQSFTFVAADTVLAAPLGNEIVFNSTITNTSTATLTLAILRVRNSLPQGWESSLCFDACFPSTIDSIATVPTFGSTPLNPAESRPFSVHVYTTGSQGTGTVQILVKNTRNSADQRILTFRASTTPNSVSTTDVPLIFTLFQNYPNPVNPTTTIRYELAEASQVALKVFNLLGQEVATLVDGERGAGLYSADFSAANLPSGFYFYRLQAITTARGRFENLTMVKKLSVVK